MELTGRVTANAKCNTLKDGRQVINFSVAVNDSYKPKGAEKAVQVTTFFDCSYWRNPGLAIYLKKGLLIEVSGRVSVNAWKGMDGEPRASLQLHVNSIKLHGKASEQSSTPVKASELTEPIDDLPF